VPGTVIGTGFALLSLCRTGRNLHAAFFLQPAASGILKLKN